MKTFSFIFCAILLFSACNPGVSDVKQAEDQIQADDLAAAIKILSSDEFQGRSPATPGEEKTIHYLADQFKTIGLKPGNGNSYFQEVPLIAITAIRPGKLMIKGKDFRMSLDYQKDFMAVTERPVEAVSLENSPLVFVGYGIVAPEYNWNDYAGIDVKGKTVVVLINDPGFATGDSSLFEGKAMTYYGRWTYKYEEAARQGASGVLIVHETKPASYPWSVVVNSWSGRQFMLPPEEDTVEPCKIEAWITDSVAGDLFKNAGLNLSVLKKQACEPGFKPVGLHADASFTLTNAVKKLISHNVIGIIPGSEKPGEYIIYTAHWDHLGRDTTLAGDQIYNGALDNASGCAGLLEIAKAFESLGDKLKRSIVILSVTGEEQGLLGSEYYAAHPVFPANKTVAEINMDGLNIFGKMKDITVIGLGRSELDKYVIEAAKAQGRTVSPDPEPEKGSYFRSDHFSFAKHGIPSLYIDMGADNVEHGRQWTLDQVDQYITQNYHRPSDEFDPDWNLSGAVEDLRLMFDIGYKLGNTDTFPNWVEGSMYKPIRDAMME